MAVVQNPITGRSKQKFASAIFSTWKGINVLRSKPLTVANPKSPGQLLQRLKLSLTVAMYRLMPGLIQIGYRQQAVGKSEYNAFSSDTIKNAFTGSTAETLEIVPAEILVAKGTMASTPIESASEETGTVEVTWDETAPLAPGQSTTDMAYACVIGKPVEGQEAVVFLASAPVARTVGTIVIPNFVSDGLEVFGAYLFFASVVGSQVSDSVYYDISA